MLKNRNLKILILIFTFFIFFILLINFYIFNVCGQNLKIKYYESWNKYTLLQFYNEISKDSIKSFNFYYIVTYDFKGRVLKFEYFANGIIEFLGEVAFYSDNFATITLKKLETQLMSTQPVLVPYAMYELYFNAGLITSYILYKVSPNLEKPVKIGDARFTYKENLTIIENIFNEKVIMRIEIKGDNENIYEINFFNDKNQLTETRIFEKNKMIKRVVYKYDPNGKLIQIITYDAAGQIISTENK